jgi:hypothetical protein
MHAANQSRSRIAQSIRGTARKFSDHCRPASFAVGLPTRTGGARKIARGGRESGRLKQSATIRKACAIIRSVDFAA